ncbi:MAG: hypothetical protein HFJ42_05050 [Clostridia bacterium]|nr:hypothetical protein [Clostridia bacterium]
MSSSLGLYIQDNLIKYAKVNKDKDTLKVEAFGIKFCDNVIETINQIVAETFSYKTPITTNLTGEEYNYFYMFNLLSKNDLKKSIDIEFDSLCYDKGINKNTLETRYALVPDANDKEKVKVISICDNKIELNKRMQQVEGNLLGNISPLSMAIANIVDVKEKENAIIVNIEDKTTITTIMDKKIYNIDKIDIGANEFLYNINQKENSYNKSYEICKNTTIYTMDTKELLQEEENLYLEDIMPTLYNIVQATRDLLDNSLEKIDKIYITGIGAVINNIDLYFQEYFPNIKCEILKPYFIPDTVKINMKDYIEVNSAIALGMQGLGYGVKNINFKKPTLSDKLPDWMKIEIGNKKGEGKKRKKSYNFKSKFNISFDLKGALDNTEKWLIRSIAGIGVFIIMYFSFSTFLNYQSDKKLEEIRNIYEDTQKQISLIQKDKESLRNKTSRYEEVLKNLEDKKNQSSESRKVKDAIPNLLTSITNGIPRGVTITSIANTSGYNIKIEAQAKEYSELGYFIGKIKTSNILYNVTTSESVKQNDIIKLVIEGTLFPE